MRAAYRDTDRPRVDKLTIVHEIDTDPDFSNLGEYSDEPGPDNRTIDRGDRGPREYRYFIAAMSGDETGNPESVEQDYQRAEQFNRGELCMYGVYARAEVSYSIGNKSRRVERFQSGGLWGIESDSGDYFEEVEQEQLDDLKDHLVHFGVDLTGWDELVAGAKHVTR